MKKCFFLVRFLFCAVLSGTMTSAVAQSKQGADTGANFSAGGQNLSPLKAKHKKFHRALIIGGGGITPGLGLGILAGVEKMGWKPDVVITTCGASMSTAMWNSYPNMQDSLNYAKSRGFFDVLGQIKVETPSIFDVKDKFDKATNNPRIPNYFSGNVLSLNDTISGFLPKPYFHSETGAPRFIMLSAKANFGPQDVDRELTKNRFTQVYFTDADTAKALQNYSSPIRKIFPESYVSATTLALSDKTTEQAARASIADPFLINPGKIDGQYYFTGAVDLFPIEFAQDIADEVLVTYPTGLFPPYEDVAIFSTFGFSQTQRVLHTIQHDDVKWIDMTGLDNVRFDPAPATIPLTIENNLPTTLQGFDRGIQAQFDFGFARAQEALRVQANTFNVRTHLRRPINPKLLKSFTCENAYEWKTPQNSSCQEDFWPGCARGPGVACTPMR